MRLCMDEQTSQMPFTHHPGTGKTTVARRLGKLLKSLGLLASDDVVECSASKLVTGFVNQVGVFPSRHRSQRLAMFIVVVKDVLRNCTSLISMAHSRCAEGPC